MSKTTFIKKTIASSVLAIFVMFGVGSTIANKPPSTSTKVTFEMTCNSDILGVLRGIERNYGEKLMWVSHIDEKDNSQVAVFYNKDNNSYTIVELRTLISKDGKEKLPVICQVAAGTADIDWKVLADWHV